MSVKHWGSGMTERELRNRVVTPPVPSQHAITIPLVIVVNAYYKEEGKLIHRGLGYDVDQPQMTELITVRAMFVSVLLKPQSRPNLWPCETYKRLYRVAMMPSLKEVLVAYAPTSTFDLFIYVNMIR